VAGFIAGFTDKVNTYFLTFLALFNHEWTLINTNC